MPNENWKEATAVMSLSSAPCNAEQRRLASLVGVEVPEGLARVVASARVRSAVAEAFGEAPHRSTDSQLEALAELAKEASEVPPVPESYAEAQAWFAYFYWKGRVKALQELRLEKGDLVRCHGSSSEIDEVVSIGNDGAVYFTGGRARAWPDEIVVVARSNDSSRVAEEARRTAANRASERSRRREWSAAKDAVLKQYAVPEPKSPSDTEELRSVLEYARDERPLQKLLEDRPQLLATTVRGPQRYCLPQVRFGDRYVADFLLAEVDSAGVRWFLVELETPDSAVTLASKDDFDKHVRDGLRQIKDWREWLQENLDYARRPRSELGLGLVDIRPESDGLVIVGRRHRLRENSSRIRQREFEESRIQVHTYDWLLGQPQDEDKHQISWSRDLARGRKQLEWD